MGGGIDGFAIWAGRAWGQGIGEVTVGEQLLHQQEGEDVCWLRYFDAGQTCIVMEYSARFPKMIVTKQAQMNRATPYTLHSLYFCDLKAVSPQLEPCLITNAPAA